jgi:hypothetical protein
MTIDDENPPESGSRDLDLLGHPDRRHAAIYANEQRWADATLCAAMTLPTDPDLTVSEWVARLDRLDRFIRQMMHRRRRSGTLRASRP